MTVTIGRRELLASLGGAAAAAWPLAARAQHSTKVARIGILGLTPAAAWAGPIEALRARLRDLGYLEGKDLLIEWKWAENGNELSDGAAQLVHMDVDLIFAAAGRSADRATHTLRAFLLAQDLKGAVRI